MLMGAGGARWTRLGDEERDMMEEDCLSGEGDLDIMEADCFMAERSVRPLEGEWSAMLSSGSNSYLP